MDHAVVSLQSVLIVLACGVAAVVICRSLRLPAMIATSHGSPWLTRLRWFFEREDTRLGRDRRCSSF